MRTDIQEQSMNNTNIMCQNLKKTAQIGKFRQTNEQKKQKILKHNEEIQTYNLLHPNKQKYKEKLKHKQRKLLYREDKTTQIIINEKPYQFVTLLQNFNGACINEHLKYLENWVFSNMTTQQKNRHLKEIFTTKYKDGRHIAYHIDRLNEGIASTFGKLVACITDCLNYLDTGDTQSITNKHWVRIRNHENQVRLGIICIRYWNDISPETKEKLQIFWNKDTIKITNKIENIALKDKKLAIKMFKSKMWELKRRKRNKDNEIKGLNKQKEIKTKNEQKNVKVSLKTNKRTLKSPIYKHSNYLTVASSYKHSRNTQNIRSLMLNEAMADEKMPNEAMVDEKMQNEAITALDIDSTSEETQKEKYGKDKLIQKYDGLEHVVIGWGLKPAISSFNKDKTALNNDNKIDALGKNELLDGNNSLSPLMKPIGEANSMKFLDGFNHVFETSDKNSHKKSIFANCDGAGMSADDLGHLIGAEHYQLKAVELDALIEEAKSESLVDVFDYKDFYSHYLKFDSYESNHEQKAFCPFHTKASGNYEDAPSLNVNYENGKFYCFSCGSCGSSPHSFLLKLYEDSPEELEKIRTKTDFDSFILSNKWQEHVWEDSYAPDAQLEIKHKCKRGKWIRKNIAHTETYLYESFDECFQGNKVRYAKTRYDFDDGSKSFNIGDGRWGFGIFYREKELVESLDKGQDIFVVEGERKADLLRSMGFVSTCLDTGANSVWNGRHSSIIKEHYKGSKFILLPDNDNAGKMYVEKWQRELKDIGIEGKIVQLPVGKKEDILDYFKQGHTKEEFNGFV